MEYKMVHLNFSVLLKKLFVYLINAVVSVKYACTPDISNVTHGVVTNTKIYLEIIKIYCSSLGILLSAIAINKFSK